MTLTTEDVRDKILEEYDPDDLIEALDISTEDLLDKFWDRLEDNSYKFMEFGDEETQEEV